MRTFKPMSPLAQSSTQRVTAQQSVTAAGGGLLTEEQSRAVFRANGTTVADWARERGFSVELTRMVLAGKRKCLRGQSHNIAVALRIKAGATDQSIA